MKRILTVCLLLALLSVLPLTAAAAPGASGLKNDTVFASDGSCQVTLTMQLQLNGDEGPVEYPLPASAAGITIGSQTVQTRQEDDLLWVTLPVSGAGSHTLQLSYRLSGLLSREKEGTFLTLPILSGFHYPISHLEFSVSFPGEISAQPVIESGYHQQNLEQLLEYSASGTAITGKSKEALKDRETLVLTVQVPDDLFHDAPQQFPMPNGWDLALFLLILAAVLYFLMTLMPKFPRNLRRATAPDGISAGDVGTCLTGCGTDLTMLVLSWAQLGYILIEMDHKNRVTLHKRMEMGNERSPHEARWFKILFGHRTMIDADSYHYAKLCRKLAAKSPLRSQLYDKRSGSPYIFRLLCCAAGIVAGLHMGIDLGASAGAKTLLGMTFACLCGVFCYCIQSGGKCLPLREKTPLWTGLGCGAAWIALAALAGKLHQAAPMVVFQFAAGIAAAFGGKRSDMGLRCLSQIQGLRRHMTTASAFDLQQLLQKNPHYFYELAPYALTLGVDRSFARRFGKIPLPEDSCLICGTVREMTASQYAARLRKVADVLNERQKRLPYEQFKGK